MAEQIDLRKEFPKSLFIQGLEEFGGNVESGRMNYPVFSKLIKAICKTNQELPYSQYLEYIEAVNGDEESGISYDDFIKILYMGATKTEQTHDKSVRKQEYVGTVRKCPNCGATIESFQARCSSCGYEFNDTSVNENLLDFSENINALDQYSPSYNLFALTPTNWAVEKSTFISSYPIPNTKEALLEFMIAVSQFTVAHGPIKFPYGITFQEFRDRILIHHAWRAKLDQIRNKARISLKGDPALSQIEDVHRETLIKLKKARKGAMVPILIFGLFYVLFFGGVGLGLYYYNSSEEKRLNGIVQEIEILVAEEKYDAAILKAQSIQYKHDDKDKKKQWNSQREALIEQIKEMKAEKK